ncbi:F0F1 ATP synthase subunit delta [Candidatus Babeliales bacterium]|nr:F0F1 ATP synthase subunit delta [Candidatus Babeliales bacterium]
MNENTIAQKYASAFLNLYINQLSIGHIEKLTLLEDFLNQNRFFYISLRIPSIELKIKLLATSKLVKFFQFKQPILTLVNILLINGRIEILHKVLKHIRFEYAKRTNLEFFRVKSSHVLTTQEKSVVAKLIGFLSKSNIRTEFTLDKDLIVGLRIESPSFLWERSIRKELMKVGKTITIKGIQC